MCGTAVVTVASLAFGDRLVVECENARRPGSGNLPSAGTALRSVRNRCALAETGIMTSAWVLRAPRVVGAIVEWGHGLGVAFRDRWWRRHPVLRSGRGHAGVGRAEAVPDLVGLAAGGYAVRDGGPGGGVLVVGAADAASLLGVDVADLGEWDGW